MISILNNRALNHYHRDPTLPFWCSNVDAATLFQSHANRPERAQAWLRYRKVSEDCSGFRDAFTIRGHFEGAILSGKTYRWTFTPSGRGDLSVAIPVLDNDCHLSDFVAMSRHDHTIWGCCTGSGQYLGVIKPPVRIHRSLANWLANDCDGVLPLSKRFLPLLANAPRIVAEDDEHAWELAYSIFIDPACFAGGDQAAAEELAYSRIEVVS
jgi:hypothetical protein